MNPYLADVENLLHKLYIAESSADLRIEDRRKAVELAAIIEEIERMIARFSKKKPFVLVDAAAGKSYVGLLCAKLLIEPSERGFHNNVGTESHARQYEPPSG